MYLWFFKRILDFLVTNTPNKLFDKLPAVKPIIINALHGQKFWTNAMSLGYSLTKKIQKIWVYRGRTFNIQTKLSHTFPVILMTNNLVLV